jgi:flagellar hook-length control protein FliK
MINAAAAILPTIPGQSAKGALPAGGDLFALSMMAVGADSGGDAAHRTPGGPIRQTLAAPGMPLPNQVTEAVGPALLWLPAVNIVAPAPMEISAAENLATEYVPELPSPSFTPRIQPSLRNGTSMSALVATLPLVRSGVRADNVAISAPAIGKVELTGEPMLAEAGVPIEPVALREASNAPVMAAVSRPQQPIPVEARRPEAPAPAAARPAPIDVPASPRAITASIDDPAAPPALTALIDDPSASTESMPAPEASVPQTRPAAADLPMAAPTLVADPVVRAKAARPVHTPDVAAALAASATPSVTVAAVPAEKAEIEDRETAIADPLPNERRTVQPDLVTVPLAMIVPPPAAPVATVRNDDATPEPRRAPAGKGAPAIDIAPLPRPLTQAAPRAGQPATEKPSADAAASTDAAPVVSRNTPHDSAPQTAAGAAPSPAQGHSAQGSDAPGATNAIPAVRPNVTTATSPAAPEVKPAGQRGQDITARAAPSDAQALPRPSCDRPQPLAQSLVDGRSAPEASPTSVALQDTTPTAPPEGQAQDRSIPDAAKPVGSAALPITPQAPVGLPTRPPADADVMPVGVAQRRAQVSIAAPATAAPNEPLPAATTTAAPPPGVTGNVPPAPFADVAASRTAPTLKRETAARAVPSAATGPTPPPAATAAASPVVAADWAAAPFVDSPQRAASPRPAFPARAISSHGQEEELAPVAPAEAVVRDPALQRDVAGPPLITTPVIAASAPVQVGAPAMTAQASVTPALPTAPTPSPAASSVAASSPVGRDVPTALTPSSAAPVAVPTAPADPAAATAPPTAVAGPAFAKAAATLQPRAFVREVSGTARQTVALRPQAAALPQPAAGTTAPASLVFGAAIHAASGSDERLRSEAAEPTLTAIAAPAAVGSAAPVVDTAQPTLDMRRGDWPNTMIDHIEALRDAANANDTRIRLIPDALGVIDVAVKTVGDAIHVRFAAEDATTRARLEEARPALALIAEERGLRIGQAVVEAASANAAGNGQSQGSQGQGNQQSGQQSGQPSNSPAGNNQPQNAAHGQTSAQTNAQTGQQQPRQQPSQTNARQPASSARAPSTDPDTANGRIA